MGRLKNILCLFLLIIFFPSYLNAEEGPTIIAVGDADTETEKIVFEDPYVDGPANSSSKALALELIGIIRNDFSFYKKKYAVTNLPLIGRGLAASPDYELLQKKAVQFYFKSELISSGGNSNLYGQFFDVTKKKKIYEGPISLTANSLREKAHILADSLYRALNNRPSIFTHKIIFVSDRTTAGAHRRKEAYLMDFDGKNVKQVTHHKGTVISPDLSYDSNSLVYSMIPEGNKNRNVDLYFMDLKSGHSKVVSSKKGINSGAVFLPDGKQVLLTLSHTGNAEIFKMNLESGQLTQITQHFAADVDPALNKEGSLMAFLSDRPGKANIYTLDPHGVEKNVKRISFVGLFNATPRFSPDGKEIVFSSWLDERFDIFRINADGSGLSRLTKDFGSNEDPSYSPDGEFIIFSSQRVLSRKSAIQNIYIMDKEGDIIGQLTHNLGNCSTPRWSK